MLWFYVGGFVLDLDSFLLFLDILLMSSRWICKFVAIRFL